MLPALHPMPLKATAGNKTTTGGKAGCATLPYHIQHVAAHLNNKALEELLKDVQDFGEIAMLRCSGLQPLDGSLCLGLMGFLLQYHNVVPRHSPGILGLNKQK